MPETGKTGFRYLSAVTRPLTRQRLSVEGLGYLARLPLTSKEDLRANSPDGLLAVALDEHANRASALQGLLGLRQAGPQPKFR